MLDWGFLLATGLMWGGSFLLVHISLESIDPSTVVWLRIVFGTVVLALIPAAWKPLKNRRDWWLVLVLALTWMAVPFTFIALAQQTIDSALAGMINGTTPLVTALIATLWFRIRPSKTLTAGLALGFIGIVVVLLPSLTGFSNVAGVPFMLAAAALYGLAFNVTGVLNARENGAISVIWRAQLIAVVLSAPLGIIGLGNSEFTVTSTAAVVALGIFATGFAYITFQLLVGRVGAPRASIATYLTPIVAMLLGVIVAGERLHPLSIGGMVLVLSGAYLASKGRKVPSSDR